MCDLNKKDEQPEGIPMGDSASDGTDDFDPDDLGDEESTQEHPSSSLEDVDKSVKNFELDESYGISQSNLEYIAENFKELKELSIAMEYDDNAPTLTFDHLSFPQLTSLSLNCVGVSGLHFEKDNYPCLENISIENSVGDIPYMRLDLPTLKSFSGQFITLSDATGFAPSICRCYNLESFDTYKFWGLSACAHNKLYMPNCESFCVYRSDDLQHLEIYAPKLHELNLQACYGLDHVRLLEDPFDRPVKCFTCGKPEVAPTSMLKKCGKCRVAQYCSKECQEKNWNDHKPFCAKTVMVNLVNANVDRTSMTLLKKHPRVRKIHKNPDDLGMFGF